MNAPPTVQLWRGCYLDGQTPVHCDATVELFQYGLRITTDTGQTRSWRFRELHQTQGFYPGEPIRLERGDESPEVLIVDDPEFGRALDQMQGARRAGFHGTRRRMVRVIAVASAGALALVLAFGLYQWGVPAAAAAIAAVVPPRWEDQLGEQAFELITRTGRMCTDARLHAALDAISARLLVAAPQTPYRFSVSVVDFPGVNAIALPGGRIVVLRGLLELTESPEMLAGVLAHEFQHVIRRHATRRMVRQAALSGLISVVTQDARWVAGALNGARVFAALQYGRAAEAEADREGLRMLQDAGIDPQGMIALFKKIVVDDDDDPDRSGLWRFLASHPSSGSRIAALTMLAGGRVAAARPIALSQPWQEIRAMCVAA